MDYYPLIEIKNAFTVEECDQIIYHLKKKLAPSALAYDQINKEIRDSESVFINRFYDSEWIFEILAEHVLKTNNQYYGFELNYFGEGAQFTKYGIGQHYTWHKDFGSQFFSNRKLSMVVQLSDQSEYQGGELEFMEPFGRTAIKDKGAMIIFPSFEYHRVKAVTEGTRYSLVSWVSGAPFR
jgi:PKHD-type hydroxylase